MNAAEITALKAENEGLRRQLLSFEALFRALPDLYFHVDDAGVFLDFRAGRNSGLYAPPEVFLGKRLEDVLPGDTGTMLMSRLREALSNGESRRAEYTLPFEGATRWFEAHFIPLETGGAATFVRDISDHRRDKEALRKLNAELEAQVRERSAAVRALSTPLVPIARGVVAVPLIGTIDTERAAQLLETLLRGVQERAASVVLLDVTGVSSMDVPAAEAVVRAAKAVGLLGARLVLTGIGPDVARTLVELGADLKEIVTLNSLEQGIAFAIGGAR